MAVEPPGRPADDPARPRGPLLEDVFLDDDPLLGVPALDLFFGTDQPRHASTASSIFGYAPQRHRLPDIACLTSSEVGSGRASTSAAAETICPGVQKPHWSASARTKESTSGCSARPSIVVTSRSPTVWTSVMQESTGTPSSCTVQAPQCPSPHATLVPVSVRSSRRVSASVRPTGGSGSSCTAPLIRRLSTTLRVRFRRSDVSHEHLVAPPAQGISPSGATGHRQDVREVDEPEGRAA